MSWKCYFFFAVRHIACVGFKLHGQEYGGIIGGTNEEIPLRRRHKLSIYGNRRHNSFIFFILFVFFFQIAKKCRVKLLLYHFLKQLKHSTKNFSNLFKTSTRSDHHFQQDLGSKKLNLAIILNRLPRLWKCLSPLDISLTL